MPEPLAHLRRVQHASVHPSDIHSIAHVHTDWVLIDNPDTTFTRRRCISMGLFATGLPYTSGQLTHASSLIRDYFERERTQQHARIDPGVKAALGRIRDGSEGGENDER